VRNPQLFDDLLPVGTAGWAAEGTNGQCRHQRRIYPTGDANYGSSIASASDPIMDKGGNSVALTLGVDSQFCKHGPSPMAAA